MILALAAGLAMACGTKDEEERSQPAAAPVAPTADRPYLLEQVDDAAVAQVYADGFETLGLREKTLTWHLYQAALAGRDIYYDQRYEHNLEMREVIEEILTHAAGVDPATLAELERYTKLFWLNTGPYNNLTARKFVMRVSPEAFAAAAHAAAEAGATFPLRSGGLRPEASASLAEAPAEAGETLDRMQPLFFDPAVDPMVTSKTPDRGQDLLLASANNLYDGVSMKDLEGFTERYGLNSRLVERDGKLVEEVYRVGGRYDAEIAEIVRHLEAAMPYATEPMARALRALIRWYRTGEKEDRRAYDIAWVEDRDSSVDTINGFTEVYMDARGVKGAWEALVFYVNQEKTEAIRTLAANAQWFEDHTPWDPKYRKEGVRGIIANAIDVVVEAGDAAPVTMIGINLPNDQTVREAHGSKSVLLSNVNEAYERSRPEAYRKEFAWSEEEVARAARWGSFAGELHVNLHEVIGHASGRLAGHLEGNPGAALRELYSTIEEARADLVGLYFIADPKLVELGIVDAGAHEDVVRAEYESYTRNALLQLRRVRQGSKLEEDHMRNRQMIVYWLMANADAIEERRRDGKTYYVLADWRAFREGTGRLLAEVQRIKSEGDYDAGRKLIETYGVSFDPALRDEVVARVDQVGLASYTGFVQPRLQAVHGPDGSIVGVTISYPQDLTQQMLEYSGKREPPES